jgi:hypothetical protein
MYFRIVMTGCDPADEGWLRGQYAIKRDGALFLHTDTSADLIREELLRTVEGVEITEISQQEYTKAAGFPADSPFVLESKR